MKCQVAFIIFGCVLALVAAQTPITKTRFKANYQETITISASGFTTGFRSTPGLIGKTNVVRNVNDFGDMTITDFGTIYYDSLGRRIRTDITKVSFDFGLGSPTVMDLSVTSLLLFDLNKNYTFDSKTCDCANLDDPDMPVLYLTPDVGTPTERGISITVNGASVTADHYSSTIYLGGSTTNIDFYVQSNTDSLVRSVFKSDLMGVIVNYQYDFWNVAALDTSSITTTFSPKSDCTCPVAAAPVMNTTTSFPTSCSSTTINGCTCPTATLPADLFCHDYITYQISSNTFIEFTDDFVKQTYTASVALMSNPSTTCTNAFKQFLCHFYFPECIADGQSLKPTDPDFDSVCGEGSAAGRNDAVSTYETASATKAGGSNTQSSSSSIVLASFVLLLAAVFASL